LKKKKTKVKEMEVISRLPSCPVCHKELTFLLRLEEAVHALGYRSERQLWKFADEGKIDVVVRQGRGRRIEYFVNLLKMRNFPKRVHKILSHIEWS